MRLHNTRPGMLIALCGLAAGASSTFADTWDNSGGNAQWSTATNWADNTEPTINDAVVFPTTIPLNQATITMTTSEFTSGITFNNDYTLQSGQMFIGAGGVSVAGGRTATINTTINGSSGLAKTGFGTLRLLPITANSFSGIVSITGLNSTLYVRSNLSLGNTANDIEINAGRLQLDGITNPTFLMTGRTITPGSSGATVELMNSAFLDLNQPIGANANPITFTGTSSCTVELNSATARTGQTTFNAVFFRLNNFSALGSPGLATLTNSAIMEINNGSGLFVGNVTANIGSTIRGGTGTHTFDGSCNVLGNMFLDGGPASTDTLILGNNGANVWNGGATAITTVRRGTVRLMSANNYVGTWAIPGSTLEVNNPGSLGTGTNTAVISSGGDLRLNTPMLDYPLQVNSTGGTITLLQDVILSANVTLNGTGAQIAGGSNRALSFDDSTLSVNAGTISTGSGFVGRTAGLTANANLTGTSSIWSSSNFVVGYSGTGNLSLTSGADISSGIAHIGSNASGVGLVTVNGTGSSWGNVGYMGVGHTGTGTLNVQSGATVTPASMFIAADPGSHGTLNIDGTGSLCTVAGSTIVGEHGVGAMTISAGGRLTDSTGFVGRMSDGVGTATVTGMNSLWTNTSALEIGGSGTGELTISAGGRVTSDSCTLGQTSGADGIVTVTGAGTTFQNDGIAVGFVGSGTLNVFAGATVTSQSESSVGGGATASVADISGTGSSWQVTGDIEIGSAGQGLLRVQGGGSFSNSGNTYIGMLNTSNGSGVVMDAGSTMTTSGSLIVGYLTGSGNFTVQNGGNVQSGQASIGNTSGTGIASVTGSGSQWNVSGSLGIGFDGIGTFQLSNSGSVSCLHLPLGFGTGASAELTMIGAATTLNCGTLGIEMGNNGATSVLNLLGGIATLDGNISDLGAGISTFTLDGATLDMQNHSIGGATPIDNLNFRSGTLKNVAQINNGAGLTKTGTGTLFLNTSNTYGGTTSINQGTLFVANSLGSATGNGLVSVAPPGVLAGFGRINGTVQNNGVVAPEGSAGNVIGTMTLQSTYIQQAGGTLRIEISSPITHDRLMIPSVSATLGGSLQVSLVNGFVPALGNSFIVLASPSISGTFATTNLPALPNGLAWEVQYNAVNVRLRVIAGGPTCDSLDFNNDTSIFDPIDIDAFLSVFSEGSCIPESATCNDIDFNNDGSLFDPCDIDSFLLQFSEGPCTLCGV